MVRKYKVYVADGGSFTVTNLSSDYVQTQSLIDADFVLFTGGGDVNPQTYKHDNVASRSLDDARDKVEEEVFKTASKKNIPMVGICRGAQKLWTLKGGVLIQDLRTGMSNAHATGHHFVRLWDGRQIEVNTSHHQMIDLDFSKIDRHSFSILAKTYNPLATEYVSYNEYKKKEMVRKAVSMEVEAFKFLDQPILGFQWHPEWMPFDRLGSKIAIELINKLVDENKSIGSR